jgi:hypothetical protein
VCQLLTQLGILLPELGQLLSVKIRFLRQERRP